MEHDASADEAVAQRRMGADPAVIAKLNGPADNRVGADLTACPEPRTGLDHHIGTDFAIGRHRRGRADDRRGCNAGDNRLCRIEGLRGARKSLVRLLCEEERHAGRGTLCKPLIDKGRPGARAGERVEIFAVVEKGHVLGAGGLERRDIGHELLAIRRAAQPGAAQLRQLVERIRPCPVEEAKIGHAAVGRGAVIFSFWAAPDRQ